MIILIAEVDPEDVDWTNTLYKSLYNLKDEKEIELKNNTTIEIVGFQITSSHPIIDKMYNSDKEYFDSLGLDGWKVAKKKGHHVVTFDEPLIVNTTT
jgi:hypothetical protein